MNESIYKKMNQIDDDESLTNENTPLIEEGRKSIDEIFKNLSDDIRYVYRQPRNVDLVDKFYYNSKYERVVAEATEQAIEVLPSTAQLEYSVQGTEGVGQIFFDNGDTIEWDFYDEVYQSMEAIRKLNSFDEFVEWYESFYMSKIEESSNDTQDSE